MINNNLVQLVDGDHTDLVFIVLGWGIGFDDEKKQDELFKIIVPLNPIEFIKRFPSEQTKDVDLSDVQILVKPDEIKKWDAITGIDLPTPGTNCYSAVTPIKLSADNVWPFAAIQAINED